MANPNCLLLRLYGQILLGLLCFFHFRVAVVTCRYLGMYLAVNCEAGEGDGYKFPMLMSDMGVSANISPTFCYVSTTV